MLPSRLLLAVLLTSLTAAVFAAGAPPPASAAAAADRFQLPPTDDGLPGAGPIRRYEWFQNLWRERRSTWARRIEADSGAIVLLGDSITQGWTSVGSTLPGFKFANRGISGDTTRGVLLRLKEDVLSLQPRGVVLLIGTNDLEEGATPETIAGNLRLLIAALKQHNPALPVILCQVFPSSDTKKRPAEQIKRINRLYFEAVRNEPQVTLLDTWTLFADDRGDAKIDEFPDLLHPNGRGYDKWASALRPVLESSGLIPAWPDEFQLEPGFVSLFNGRDLTGWTTPDGESLDAGLRTADGRFAAVNGRLLAVMSRLERTPRKLVTRRQFAQDFVLRLEFRASPNADSGVYVREPQVQCRDFPLAGPYYGLQRYRPLEWNTLEITVRGGLAHAECNGEVIIDAMPVPASGPIGIENDRGQMEYRRIRVRELR
jgi:lysophospholipase L1-like esterase